MTFGADIGVGTGNKGLIIIEIERLRAEVAALRALLNEAWPYVGENLQERIDAAMAAKEKKE